MPTSVREGKDWSAQHILQDKPTTVIDVGAGEGTYSTLLRDKLTNCIWVGIEVYEPYIDQYDLTSKYDIVVLGDVREVEFTDPDLIIFGDVIEHMPREDAISLLERAKQHAKNILVSLPIIYAPQGAVNGNEAETHHYHWGFDEMHSIMDECEALRGEILGVYYWSRRD